MAGRIVALGSINVDLVVAAAHLPAPGETVLGGRFSRHHGGKGANQAVAAARAGASVALIGVVGSDADGEASVAALAAEGVDCSAVRRDTTEPTGVALIAVGPRGENQIVVAPGANALLSPDDLAAVPLAAGDVLLANHEVPLEVVEAALHAARVAGAIAILNPAPAHALSAAVLAAGPILTPNEHELTVAIGDDDTEQALETLVERTAAPVIVTQGAAGALLAHGNRREHFAGQHAEVVVDTTGAGDTFTGVLASWLVAGSDLDESIRAANAAAALSVSAAGAREGMPTREAILGALGARGDER